MGDEYTVFTPENVVLRYDVAGLGSRLVAALLDYVVIGVGATILTIGGAAIAQVVSLTPLAGSRYAPLQWLAKALGAGFPAFSVVLAFLLWWGYFFLCETLWNGQSAGKRWFGLRVVRANGQPVDVVASLVRNVLRVVDLLLFVGVLVMLIDRHSRRLGDLAAGTLVVRQPRGKGWRDFGPDFNEGTIPATLPAAVTAFPNANRLTAQHYAVLRAYFERRRRLDPAAAAALARRLAQELAALVDASPAEVADAPAFLAAAARAYEERHRYDEGTD